MIYGILGIHGPWADQQRIIDNAKAAAIEQVKADVLRRDFEETAGANFLRGESNSIVVTLRESSSLAPSRIDYLTGVWDRIHRETGCDIGSTTRLEAIPGFLWSQKEQEAYAVTVTNCPPIRVQLTQ